MMPRQRLLKLLGLLAGAALLLAVTGWGVALAQGTPPAPVLPQSFWGSVKDVNGNPITYGTVEAWMGGIKRDSIAIVNGQYGGPGGFEERLLVQGNTEDVGKTIEFYVNGTRANETANYSPGVTTRLDLTVADTVPPALQRVKPVSLVGLPYRAADYTGDMVFTWEADEELDTQAAVTAAFTPQQGETVEGLVTYAADAKGLTVVPAADLAAGTRYVLTVSGVKDRAGNQAANLVVEFSTYAIGPAPVVTGLEPATAVSGKPDQTVTVTGQNFQDGARVVLCREGQADTVVAAVYRSGTELAFTVPVDLAPGLYMVKVRNPDGQTSTEHVLLTLYAGEAPRAQAFPGATGSAPGEIRPDGAVRVEVPVQVAQAYQSALVVIRVDDPDGRPMLAAVEGPLPANTEVKFSASFNLPGKAGSYTVKAFVWDGWQTMNPLVAPAQSEFQAR